MIRTEINIREPRIKTKNKKKKSEDEILEFMKRLTDDKSQIYSEVVIIFPEK